MGRIGRVDRGVAVVALSLSLVAGCGGSGSGSDDATDNGGGQPETARELRDVDLFDVAAGEGKGWLLTSGEPGEIWEVGPDGTLTRRGDLSEVGDGIDAASHGVAAVGDGVAVAQFDCADADDDYCRAGAVADLFLIDEHGAVDHELRLWERDGVSLQGTSVGIVGSSDEHVWVEVSTDVNQLFAVSRSGEVETIPFELREFAADRPCVVAGQLLMVRAHTDRYDPELGPLDSGVAVSPDTPIRTTVALEAFVDGRWRPVEGSERTFEPRRDEARVVCGPSSVGVVDPNTEPGGAATNLAQWTREGGWVEAPTGPAPPAPPPESVGVDGCADCVWGAGGEILRRGEDGSFQATGLVVAAPEGVRTAPNLTQVDIRADGTMAACARFPQSGPGAGPAATAGPSTATVTGLATPRRSPGPGGRASRPGAGLPTSQPEASIMVCDVAPA